MTKVEKDTNYSYSEHLHGRTKILVDDTEVTRENVISVLIKAINVQSKNEEEIRYLYNYKKGIQPSLYREKEVRPEITSHIVENRAHQIVNFKTGYMLGSSKPIQYIASCSDGRKEELTEEVAKLNEFMDDADMSSGNKELFEWIFTCGIGFKMALPNKEAFREHDTPFDGYVLDPRNTFVVYSNELGEPPIMGVRCVRKEDGSIVYSCYTKYEVFTVREFQVRGEKKYDVEYETLHILDTIPIIEYVDNKERMGAFEVVITELDAINQTACERQEAIEQYIQALLLMHNTDLSAEDYDELRARGAIQYSDLSPDKKAEIKYISLELNQTNTQTLVDSRWKSVLEICGMPSMAGGETSDSSNNGAVIMRQGWGQAEASAKNSEEQFKKAERKFLKLVLRICNYNTGVLKDLTAKDVQIRFTRRNYEDIQTKAQVLNMLLNNDKIDPKLAFEHSGLFVDPERAYLQSVEYLHSLEEKQKDSQIQANVQVDEQSSTEDKNVAENSSKQAKSEGTDVNVEGSKTRND